MAFLLLSILFSQAIAGTTNQSVGGLQGYVIRTTDDRSFKLVRLMDYGHSGDIYQAIETTPKADLTPKVIKILDLHNDPEDIKEMLRNFKTAKAAIPVNSNLFLNFEYLSLASKGLEAEAILLMPQVSSTLDQEIPKNKTIEQRLRLAGEVFTLYIQAATFLIEGNFSHGDITLSNIGRLSDGSLRIFDFDSFQRVGNMSTLLLSNNNAPELIVNGRTSIMSDMYNMGSSLFQILSGVEHNPTITKQQVLKHFQNMHDQRSNVSSEINLATLELFIFASLENNPVERRQKMIEALQVLQSNTSLSIPTRRTMHNLLTTLEKTRVRSGVLHSFGLFCRDLF